MSMSEETLEELKETILMMLADIQEHIHQTNGFHDDGTEKALSVELDLIQNGLDSLATKVRTLL